MRIFSLLLSDQICRSHWPESTRLLPGETPERSREAVRAVMQTWDFRESSQSLKLRPRLALKTEALQTQLPCWGPGTGAVWSEVAADHLMTKSDFPLSPMTGGRRVGSAPRIPGKHQLSVWKVQAAPEDNVGLDDRGQREVGAVGSALCAFPSCDLNSRKIPHGAAGPVLRGHGFIYRSVMHHLSLFHSFSFLLFFFFF